MALRILSGLVFIPRGGTRTGNVVISFDPFELSTASSNGIELRKRRQIGPAGRFTRRPASIVAARQFAHLFPLPHASSYRARINDTATRDFISIAWNASGGRVDQEEIPFMIVGEVPDPQGAAAPRRRRRPAQAIARRRSRAQAARRKR